MITPATRKDLNNEQLYNYYLMTRSYKKTGEHFHCSENTVKRRLKKNGYI